MLKPTHGKFRIRKGVQYFLYATQLVLCFLNARSQNQNENQFPQIGKPCPPFFLNEVVHYTKNKVSGKDFKGKWLILDFWNMHCSTCLITMPKVSELQLQFKEKVQFLLVGDDDTKFNKGIRQMYEKYQKKYNLQVAVAYDSVLFIRFGVTYVPHIIWIDDKGIVRGVTEPECVTAENIQKLINGEDIRLPEKLNEGEFAVIHWNLNEPFLINGNGGDDTAFYIRSVLTGFKKGVPSLSFAQFQPMGFWKPNSILVTNSSLGRLYETAYGDTIADYATIDADYGKWWIGGPFLDIMDSSLFISNFETEKNLFCYSLEVPLSKADKGAMQKIMQQELKTHFNFDATVETRMMPCWKIKATVEARARLATKGGKALNNSNYAGLHLTNQSMGFLLGIIKGLNQHEPLFIDETGITGNIDLSLQAILTDFTDLKEKLATVGIELVKEEQEMKVIVIRDPVRSVKN